MDIAEVITFCVRLSDKEGVSFHEIIKCYYEQRPDCRLDGGNI